MCLGSPPPLLPVALEECGRPLHTCDATHSFVNLAIDRPQGREGGGFLDGE
jgi:hypothetical protein